MEIIHLAGTISTACSSFRRAVGAIGFSLSDYHHALNPSDTERCCKTCYPHYVRRMNEVNRRRTLDGRKQVEIKPLV